MYTDSFAGPPHLVIQISEVVEQGPLRRAGAMLLEEEVAFLSFAKDSWQLRTTKNNSTYLAKSGARQEEEEEGGNENGKEEEEEGGEDGIDEKNEAEKKH